ncbi:MAG: glycosyltransferase family 2 protein [Phototrophicales bacterium]|nr:MAG: glycosyltransferase family 2 protein [Phototrophicales bacterium]
MTDTPRPDVSVIIVSWNVANLLRDCLNSIYENSPDVSLEVIVVDSASGDDTLQMVKTHFPQVILSAQSENVGFTRGNNIGLEMARGRYVFLLNPDTVILGDAIGQMVAYLDAHPQVGIIGPHTLNTDMTHQSTRRRFPTIGTAFFESTWLQQYAPRTLLDRYYVCDIPDDATADVDWVQGSALMARREVYEEIGGLDTRYIMFWEELDWCKRAKLAGWGVVYLGTSKIIHHGGKSTEQAGARKHIHFQQSKLRYYKKFFGSGFAVLLRLFLLWNYAWQIGIEGLKALLGSKRTLRRERIGIYWQVLRSGLKVS